MRRSIWTLVLLLCLAECTRVAVQDVSPDALSRLIPALDLAPGQLVADIGASDVYRYDEAILYRIGETGRLYVEDIDQAALERHRKGLYAALSRRWRLRERATYIKGSPTNPSLKGYPDRIYIADAYHQFESPVEMLRTIRYSLQTGGKLVVTGLSSASSRRESRTEQRSAEHIDPAIVQAELTKAGFQDVTLSLPSDSVSDSVAQRWVIVAKEN